MSATVTEVAPSTKPDEKMPNAAGEKGAARLAGWQEKLLPFMMAGLVAIGVVFFIATFWNYAGVKARLNSPVQSIEVTLDKLQAAALSDSQRDWYVRVVLEDRALRSRHEQNAAVVEARVWTRFMGFMTGMVMVMAGCIFILGKLEAAFDGAVKSSGSEGTLKTNSPGLVLAVVGSVLIAISLSVTVQVEVNDKPVYLPELVQEVGQKSATLKPPLPLELPPAALAPASRASSKTKSGGKTVSEYPEDVRQQMCRLAGKPPNCMDAK